MTAETNYAELFEKLKALKEDLKDDEHKDLLTGIMSIAHGLTDSTHVNGASVAGASDFRPEFDKAFDPLPREKIDAIRAYKDDPNMIVKHETLPSP